MRAQSNRSRLAYQATPAPHAMATNAPRNFQGLREAMPLSAKGVGGQSRKGGTHMLTQCKCIKREVLHGVHSPRPGPTPEAHHNGFNKKKVDPSSSNAVGADRENPVHSRYNNGPNPICELLFARNSRLRELPGGRLGSSEDPKNPLIKEIKARPVITVMW